VPEGGLIMKENMIEKQKQFLIRMRNGILFTLAITSVSPHDVSANGVDEKPKVENTLVNSYLKNELRGRLFQDYSEILNIFENQYNSFANFYQNGCELADNYLKEQLQAVCNIIGDRFLNKVDLVESEILPQVLNYYHMNEQDYNLFVAKIIEASSKYAIHWNSREEITKMFYVSSTVSNEEKLSTVLEAYNLSYNDFMVYVGVVSAESKKIMVDGKSVPCYIDSTAVATNINGRANSKKWNGGTVCSQVSRRGQYQVYAERTYLKYMSNNHPGYQAALDVMYHNVLCKQYGLPLLQPTVWLQFVSNGHRIDGTRVVSGGNKFRDVQKDSDLIVPYVPTLDPMFLDFIQEENGKIKIIVPKKGNISTPNNAIRTDALRMDVQELKLKM